MELSEMIKVMQHYENGREVEYSNDNFKTILGSSNNENLVGVSWNWDTYEYRIKKQKVTIEKWLMKDVDSGEHFMITSSDINLYLKAFPKWRKLKPIETYEVEL